MTTQIELLGYDTKPAEYFHYPRPEMLPFVPSRCRRVLDVGCAEGAFGESLKKSRGIEVWGVEPNKLAAEKASAKLDRVIQGMFSPEIDLLAGSFDCILFNDVLEHMVAPEIALRHARDLLAPGGVIVASIPNIRSFPTAWQFLFHARWEYEDAGILDKTHLRFFTKSSIVNMFEREGFALESIRGINAYPKTPDTSINVWRAYRLVSALFPARFGDMKFQQFAVVAKPKISL